MSSSSRVAYLGFLFMVTSNVVNVLGLVVGLNALWFLPAV